MLCMRLQFITIAFIKLFHVVCLHRGQFPFKQKTRLEKQVICFFFCCDFPRIETNLYFVLGAFPYLISYAQLRIPSNPSKNVFLLCYSLPNFILLFSIYNFSEFSLTNLLIFSFTFGMFAYDICSSFKFPVRMKRFLFYVEIKNKTKT